MLRECEISRIDESAGGPYLAPDYACAAHHILYMAETHLGTCKEITTELADLCRLGSSLTAQCSVLWAVPESNPRETTTNSWQATAAALCPRYNKAVVRLHLIFFSTGCQMHLLFCMTVRKSFLIRESFLDLCADC